MTFFYDKLVPETITHLNTYYQHYPVIVNTLGGVEQETTEHVNPRRRHWPNTPQQLLQSNVSSFIFTCASNTFSH